MIWNWHWYQFWIWKIFLVEKYFKHFKEKKISSVIFFKEVYNLICEKDNKRYFFNYIIKNENIQKYNFINTIITNINDYRNRYLLLEIKPSLINSSKY